jgi:psiF repeat
MQIRPALAALCAVATLAVFAMPGAQAANSQQEKMKACNAQAAGKKGDERKAFMKQCLSAAAPAAAASGPMTQQEKMKACNAQAAGKKGDERKAFMKQCLSASPAA